MRGLFVDTPAKINLILNITGRREDGYHTLRSVMQTVSLYDRVLVRPTEGGGIVIGCNLPWLPRDRRNLAWRAAESFFVAAGIPCPGIAIHIKKSIPVGAGMAGGSTDAAAVLRILAALYSDALPDERLMELALSLGADVPFCMRGGAMLAEGIGEELTPVPSMPDCPIVICKPPISVSTKRAYELVDAYRDAPPPYPIEPLLAAMHSGDAAGVARALGNTMEAPLFAERPRIGEIKAQLLSLGAQGAVMSGSGSAVLGIFEHDTAARHAEAELKKRWREVFRVRPVAQLEPVRRETGNH